jgi:serine/threonine-protein kinase HipA
MYGVRVGVLTRQRGALSFAYTPEGLELGLGLPLLSVSMPIRAGTYGDAAAKAFFSGLLPEGKPRKILEYDLNLKENDVFGLLRVLGRDCAGALVVIPDGEAPEEEEGVPETIADAEIAERLRKLRIQPLGMDGRVRVSLAGMQQKLLLARLGDGWGLPIDGAPSTHLIKPAHDFLPHVIANEALCVRIARELGMPTAEVEVGDFDGIPVLIIKRYDRSEPDAQHRVARLHQEDFCQAHSLDGMYKYEAAGGPSLRQCAAILGRWTAVPGQLEQLLDITTLNVLIGNADAHAKNISLLHSRDGRVQLAPAYDLLSTAFYEIPQGAGMFVNGVRDMPAITRDDLILEAVSWGLAREVAAARIEGLLAQGEDAIVRAASNIDCPDALVEKLLARAQALAPRAA